MAEKWRTVRVFISSTFRDMHAERDHLVKVVFPELRERMAKRNLYLIDVDLRWGVTEEEAEQGKVLEVCLDEIEHCRPFFIGILGERYGYIPPKMLEDTEFTHPWLAEYKGHSLTALEIIHGVLRDPDLAQRSFFYLRDPSFIPQVPESKRTDYTSESPEAVRKLAILKEKIRASGRPIFDGYPCRWDENQAHLADLDAFGQRVLEDLWSAISTTYPEEAVEADPLTVERQMHEAFAEERSRLHVGREEQAKRLTGYLQGKDRRPVVITGESGCGKSAFLASWYRRYAVDHPDELVLAYFIGASPDSTNHFRLLRNMCQELKRNFALKEEIPEDDKKLSETLAILLATASRGKSRIVLMLDALDQLSVQKAAHGLGWLLDYVPENVCLVMSTLESECLDVLRRREAEEITLLPLNTNEQRQIVQALLSEWRRKLDNRQMAGLLAHPGVKNPLYLRVALEELRLFGSFEQLTARIDSLAKDIPGLFDQVLARLEEDHGRELVAEAFALVVCSRYGLSEAELLDLLPREGEEQFPRALWARLVRSARGYIVQRGELLSFYHQHLADAVAKRYLSQDNKHAKLAEYFGQAPLERRLDEYPYQLQQAEQWQALAGTLGNLAFFDYALQHGAEYEWMGYWRSLERRFKPGTFYRAAIESREESEGETYDIARLMYAIGFFLHDMGLYPSALPFSERAVEIFERILGPDHPDVAESLNRLAQLYQSQGRYADALPLYQRSLTIRERTFGSDHIEALTSRNNLASLYLEQGKLNEALPLFQRALAVAEHTLGPEHPIVATNNANLAHLYSEQGRYDEAISFHQHALAIAERTFGHNNPQVATCLNNISETYRKQGKYTEALPLYQRSLAIRERTLGFDHPEVAESLNNLALFYSDQAKFDEALPFGKRALSIRESALGPNHSLVAQSLNNLAWIYHRQGKHDQAFRLYERAVTVWERALGPDRPKAAPGLNNLANLYADRGEYDEALPLYQCVLAITESALGPDHPDVAGCLNNLATLYAYKGEYDMVPPLLERAVSIAEAALGPSHPSTKLFRNNLKSFQDTVGWNTGH